MKNKAIIHVIRSTCVKDWCDKDLPHSFLHCGKFSNTWKKVFSSISIYVVHSYRKNLKAKELILIHADPFSYARLCFYNSQKPSDDTLDLIFLEKFCASIGSQSSTFIYLWVIMPGVALSCNLLLECIHFPPEMLTPTAAVCCWFWDSWIIIHENVTKTHLGSHLSFDIFKRFHFMYFSTVKLKVAR